MVRQRSILGFGHFAKLRFNSDSIGENCRWANLEPESLPLTNNQTPPSRSVGNSNLKLSQRLGIDEFFSVQASHDNGGCDRDRIRIDTMIAYATHARCRSQQLLDYFGETDTDLCGRCDICLTERASLLDAPSYGSLFDRLQAWLAQEPNIPIERIKERMNHVEQEEFMEAINHWVEEGLVKLEDGYLKRG